MCRSCDDPSYTDDDHLDWIVETIETFGWALQYVEPDGDRPPFAYTIGLTGYGNPELAVTGLDSRQSAALLNTSADDLVGGRALVPGGLWLSPFAPMLEAVEVAVPDVHLVFACALYGTPAVDALQLVYSDSSGTWPWDPGYRKRGWNQYLLGPRADAKTVGRAL